jgi:hypothetical protein
MIMPPESPWWLSLFPRRYLVRLTGDLKVTHATINKMLPTLPNRLFARSMADGNDGDFHLHDYPRRRR